VRGLAIETKQGNEDIMTKRQKYRIAIRAYRHGFCLASIMPTITTIRAKAATRQMRALREIGALPTCLAI